ncbi:MAG: RIP metalloprotease RseP [Candidatus Magasanikbacteria bacterium]|nr:RIP metalloprotease RseP [Candidatus Magasanikbacteria bacterium]
MFFTLVVFIVILAVLVLAHELGHFIVARKSGIKVEEFGFGFPPRLFGFQRVEKISWEKVAEKEEIEARVSSFEFQNKEIVEEKIVDRIREVDRVVKKRGWRLIWGGKERGEEAGATGVSVAGVSAADWRRGTIYSLNLIPLGGFVKIKGENGEAADEPDSFGHKKIWQRVLVLAAGVFMNFILAGFLLGIGFIIGLPQSLDEVGAGAKVKDAKIEVMSVLPDSPASAAGILPGDEIIQVGAVLIHNIRELQSYVGARQGQKVKFVLQRGGVALEKEIKPVLIAETKRGGIGVALLESGVVSYPWYEALPRGFETAALYSREVVSAFGSLLADLARGRAAVADNLAGPVGIAVLTGKVAKLGFAHLLQFAALLSINLAILNILPFPALDGGRIFFLAVEKARGRPIRRKIEGIVHTVGFALLMLLVIFVTYKDVTRWSASFINLGKKIIGG